MHRYDFTWLKVWSKIGSFSGLESFIRNSVYLAVILKAVNELNEQGSYWIANTFFWNWLLLPILPLGDVMKKDIASNLTNDCSRLPFKFKIIPYLAIILLFLVFWILSIPAWTWFLRNVLYAHNDYLVLKIIKMLTPCYAVFAFSPLFCGVLYALGKTKIMTFKTIIGNTLIVILFVLYSNSILFQQDIYGISTIFGIGLVCGTMLSSFFLYFSIRKSDKI